MCHHCRGSECPVPAEQLQLQRPLLADVEDSFKGVIPTSPQECLTRTYRFGGPRFFGWYS